MCEDIDKIIYSYLPFEDGIKFGFYENYDKKIHTWEWAAVHGHLEFIKWLHENGIEGCTVRTFGWFGTREHFEINRFLIEKYPDLANKTKCLLW